MIEILEVTVVVSRVVGVGVEVVVVVVVVVRVRVIVGKELGIILARQLGIDVVKRNIVTVVLVGRQVVIGVAERGVITGVLLEKTRKGLGVVSVVIMAMLRILMLTVRALNQVQKNTLANGENLTREGHRSGLRGVERVPAFGHKPQFLIG